MTDTGPTGTGDEPISRRREPAPRGWRVMAVVRWVIVLVMAVIAVLSVLHYFGALQAVSAKSSSKVYYCPMHPSVVQDHPGECPICSMTLVEKTDSPTKKPEPPKAANPPASSLPELAAIDLTPERIQLLGMRTAKVVRQTLTGELRTVGYVTANERGLAQIQTRFSGWIEQLAVNQTGEHVARGQVLAKIYSPDLLSAQQEFLNALRWSKSGTTSEAGAMTAGLADDARHRLELLGISAKEIDEIAKTGQPTRALVIRSPVDGYVTQKNALPGVFTQPGTKLFEIADLSTVWVIADVYEYEVGRVRVGAKAELQILAYPGQTFTGRVQFLYPTVDTDSRTLKVRLEFKNPGLLLRPGMYGNVIVKLPPTEGLVVPSEAVVDTGETQYLFVAQAGGHFEPRKVRVGFHADGKVQILAGVAEGESVVTTANFLIDSESRLRATIEGTSSSEDVPIDKNKYPDKYQQWKQCEIEHHGMGTMEQDCKNAIPKPWR